MFGRLSKDKLSRSGFQLESCEDGHFWVYEKETGEDAGRLLRICRRALANFEEDTVNDIILIQCKEDLSEPELYLDGYIWQLTKRDLADIARLLFKDRQKMVKEQLSKKPENPESNN